MALLALHACSDFDAERLFVSHVTSIPNGGLKNLHGGKVSCLHCPIYFVLDTGPELVSKIVAEQRLHQVANLPRDARQVEELVQKQANWWEQTDLEANDKVYWIHYNSKRAGLESAFRLLVVKGKRSFFITSGHFNPAYYEAGDA
jgi:hypothetical protein